MLVVFFYEFLYFIHFLLPNWLIINIKTTNPTTTAIHPVAQALSFAPNEVPILFIQLKQKSVFPSSVGVALQVPSVNRPDKVIVSSLASQYNQTNVYENNPPLYP